MIDNQLLTVFVALLTLTSVILFFIADHFSRKLANSKAEEKRALSNAEHWRSMWERERTENKKITERIAEQERAIMYLVDCDDTGVVGVRVKVIAGHEANPK